jgi:hypothetical protein
MHLSLDVRLEVPLSADVGTVQSAVLTGMDDWFRPPGAAGPMGFVIEPHVGGRVYRDLGEGQGHLWGHITVLKPGLIEIVGPLFIPTPSQNLLRFRIAPTGPGRCTLEFSHQAVGVIPVEMLAHTEAGWRELFTIRFRELVEQRSAQGVTP